MGYLGVGVYVGGEAEAGRGDVLPPGWKVLAFTRVVVGNLRRVAVQLAAGFESDGGVREFVVWAERRCDDGGRLGLLVTEAETRAALAVLREGRAAAANAPKFAAVVAVLARRLATGKAGSFRVGEDFGVCRVRVADVLEIGNKVGKRAAFLAAVVEGVRRCAAVENLARLESAKGEPRW